jgi:hypothetical protein
MARRKFKKAGFNTKLIMDVGLAGLATRVLPIVVNKFMPLDPTLYAVVGAGGTYLVGSMLKKPDLANAGIALGIVELVAPMVEDLIGGVVGNPTLPSSGVKPLPPMKSPVQKVALDDYLRLNDYVSSPMIMQGNDFRHAYNSNIY